MTGYVDGILDHITMYRLVLYYLAALVVAALGLSLAGLLPFAPEALALSLLVAIVACAVANFIFARIFVPDAEQPFAHVLRFILIDFAAKCDRAELHLKGEGGRWRGEGQNATCGFSTFVWLPRSFAMIPRIPLGDR